MIFTTPWDDGLKHRIRAQLGNTTIEGLALGWHNGLGGQRALSIAIDGAVRDLSLFQSDDWTITILPDPIVLPTEPGTVIAIGDWWLVRLRPYESAASAWELLPMPTAALNERVKSQGIATQCVYGDDWVLAEAEQEGSFIVISRPTDKPQPTIGSPA